MNELYQKPHGAASPETSPDTSETSVKEGLGIISMIRAAIQRRRTRITHDKPSRGVGYYVNENTWPIALLGEFEEEDRRAEHRQPMDVIMRYHTPIE